MPRHTSHRAPLLVLLTALFFTTASCAAEPTNTPPDVEQVASVPDTGAGEDDAESFSAEQLDGELVSSFPADVPLYDGPVVNSVSAWSDSAERPEWNALIGTDDAMSSVDDGVRGAYSTSGWEIRSDTTLGDMTQLIAHNPGYIVSITYQENSGVTINYGVTPK